MLRPEEEEVGGREHRLILGEARLQGERDCRGRGKRQNRGGEDCIEVCILAHGEE